MKRNKTFMMISKDPLISIFHEESNIKELSSNKQVNGLLSIMSLGCSK